MAWWGELAAKVASVAADISAMIRQNSAEKTGAAKQREADDEATMDTLKNVGAPVTRSERDELWERNKAKFGPDGEQAG